MINVGMTIVIAQEVSDCIFETLGWKYGNSREYPIDRASRVSDDIDDLLYWASCIIEKQWAYSLNNTPARCHSIINELDSALRSRNLSTEITLSQPCRSISNNFRLTLLDRTTLVLRPE